MKEILIGRRQERQLIEKWLDSDRSEFIAVYGRRRVGKTFLIRKTVGDNFTFTFSGSVGLSRKDNLLNFGLALREQSDLADLPIPANWIEAFHSLKKLIEASKKSKKIVFLDELPWLDTPKSGFIGAFENFWNSWASWREDVKLIVCGSATSWIINKIIRDRGGLHNRITHSLCLQPFHLGECEEYFNTYGFKYGRMQIAECYMTMGGIPYYFSLMEKGESVAQNIDRLFFREDAPLRNEFDDLFRALYKNYQNHIKIVRVLGEKGIGLTRCEIVCKTGLSDNGEFSKALEELELCGFIRSYLPFKGNSTMSSSSRRTSRNTLYQLIDFYSLFYLKFHDRALKSDNNFWSASTNSPKLNTWRGLTFELLCQCHIQKIKSALGISDVSTDVSAWRGEHNDEKAQIDMVIDRKDGVINICEMKFSHSKFTIDKRYAARLEEKVNIFMEATYTDKTVLLTMITAKGLNDNSYSYIVQREVTLDELF